MTVAAVPITVPVASRAWRVRARRERRRAWPVWAAVGLHGGVVVGLLLASIRLPLEPVREEGVPLVWAGPVGSGEGAPVLAPPSVPPPPAPEADTLPSTPAPAAPAVVAEAAPAPPVEVVPPSPPVVAEAAPAPPAEVSPPLPPADVPAPEAPPALPRVAEAAPAPPMPPTPADVPSPPPPPPVRVAAMPRAPAPRPPEPARPPRPAEPAREEPRPAAPSRPTPAARAAPPSGAQGPLMPVSPSEVAATTGVRLGAGMSSAPGVTQGVGAPQPGCADVIPYPPDERRRGVTGSVNLRLRIRDNGGVVEARVIESSGSFALDEAAVAGIRRCRFVPALRDGVNVFGSREYRVVFRLE